MSAPYLLALETSTPRCSVALFEGEKKMASMTYNQAKSHSRILPLMIEKLLHISGLQVGLLGAVGISTGPGSYTGLRIGAAVGKGICYGQGIPLLGVGTLDLLCASLMISPEPDMYWGLMDASNGRSYGLLLDKNRNVVLDAQVFTMEEATFLPWLEKGSILFIGSGAEKYEALFTRHEHARLVRGVYPDATAMGELLHEKFVRSECLDLDRFVPTYLGGRW